MDIITYFVIGLIFCVLVIKTEFCEDFLNTDNWKRIYRVLFKLSFIVLWPMYMSIMVIGFLFGICWWLIKSIIEIFK